MDPSNPDSFNHRKETLSTGRTYHFVDQRPDNYDPATTRTLLCIHGFPDLWYGWRYQIGPWVRAGYRVLAPDMLGYGGTGKPADPAAYSLKRLCEDLAALLDIADVERAVIVGHDWGAVTAWRFALYYPERVLALVTASVPFTPPPPVYVSPEEAARRIPNFAYQVYFANEKSTEHIEKNLPAFLSIVFTRKIGQGFVRDPIKVIEKVAAAPQSALDNMLLTKQEYDFYLKQFSEGGMLGPLSYYRTARIRFEEEQACSLPSHVSTNFPVLFLWGKDDPTCSLKHVEKSQVFVKTQRMVCLEGVHHWVMLQAKDAVAAEVIRFLRDSLDATSKL